MNALDKTYCRRYKKKMISNKSYKNIKFSKIKKKFNQCTMSSFENSTFEKKIIGSKSNSKIVCVKSLHSPRKSSLSIAIPVCIMLETCIKPEIKTYVIGQIARYAAIYSVEEIIVYDDRCYSAEQRSSIQKSIDMMTTLLQYSECPQYLRKHLFPYSEHLSKAGLLNALNSSHHLLPNEWCGYREAVVSDEDGWYADAGLTVPVKIDRCLKKGLRITIKISHESMNSKCPYGTVVSPDAPKTDGSFYWGYNVRIANTFNEVFDSPYNNTYDLIIGTSDKGDNYMEQQFPEHENALIVFGGVHGLEQTLEADTRIFCKEPRKVFHYYVNTCPMQSTKTIRTEEAILISLCALQQKLLTN